jgi:hypothetical protein
MTFKPLFITEVKYTEEKSMEANETKLEQLKSRNPYLVPEGYMEGLTDLIMSRIPQDIPQEKQQAKVVTMYERIRPFLYLAAVFIGLIFLFKALNNVSNSAIDTSPPSEYAISQYSDDAAAEDEEYFEYLQNAYYTNLVAENFDVY